HSSQHRKSAIASSTSCTMPLLPSPPTWFADSTIAPGGPRAPLYPSECRVALTPPQAPRRHLLEWGSLRTAGPMTPVSLPAHAQVAEELQSLEASLEPSELHGSLCGYISGGGKHDRAGWFAAVMSDPLLAAPAPDGPIDLLYRASAAQLESP